MAKLRLCSIPDCGKPHWAKGWCSLHYRRNKKHGTPLPQIQPQRLCSIPGCGNPHDAQGWCRVHYGRWRMHGDPLASVRILSSAGEGVAFLENTAFIYEGDECLLWPFGRDGNGRAQLHYEGRMRKAHRVVCERTHGAPPTPKHHAAHLCGNGHLGCVAKRHLAWKTPAENVADKLVHGTHNRGERHNQAKLTTEQVKDIREGNETLSETASKYGISIGHVSSIRRRRTWRWLT